MRRVKLFDRGGMVALDKPPGVSMATSSREGKSGEAAVQRLLEVCGEPADAGLLLIHRLDLGTSGVVLLARDAESHRAVSRALQEGRARKTYRALVWGRPRPDHGTYDDPLGRDPRDGRRMTARRDGKRAVTAYRTIARLGPVCDVELSPETGRTHQIRVHLAAHGHPIVGDDLYGGATRWRGVRDPRQRRGLASVMRPLLHAARIEIPELGLDVSAPMPFDYLRALEILGSKSAGTPSSRRTRA